ncbi:MAG: hypothetical protein ACLR5H_11950 [Oscillospiraceae bacterium]
MNPMHQLTRRPVKAAFGALLLALAGVILALSGDSSGRRSRPGPGWRRPIPPWRWSPAV